MFLLDPSLSATEFECSSDSALLESECVGCYSKQRACVWGPLFSGQNPVFPDGTCIKVGLNSISRQEYVMYESIYGRRIGHWCSAQFSLQSNNALNR